MCFLYSGIIYTPPSPLYCDEHGGTRYTGQSNRSTGWSAQEENGRLLGRQPPELHSQLDLGNPKLINSSGSAQRSISKHSEICQ